LDDISLSNKNEFEKSKLRQLKGSNMMLTNNSNNNKIKNGNLELKKKINNLQNEIKDLNKK
jgi:hypothetical protein